MNGRILQFKFENKVNESPCLCACVCVFSWTQVNALLENRKAEEVIPLCLPHFSTPNWKEWAGLNTLPRGSTKLLKIPSLYTFWNICPIITMGKRKAFCTNLIGDFNWGLWELLKVLRSLKRSFVQSQEETKVAFKSCTATTINHPPIAAVYRLLWYFPIICLKQLKDWAESSMNSSLHIAHNWHKYDIPSANLSCVYIIILYTWYY